MRKTRLTPIPPDAHLADFLLTLRSLLKYYTTMEGLLTPSPTLIICSFFFQITSCIFFIALITIWNYIIDLLGCLPPLKCKLHESRDLICLSHCFIYAINICEREGLHPVKHTLRIFWDFSPPRKSQPHKKWKSLITRIHNCRNLESMSHKGNTVKQWC